MVTPSTPGAPRLFATSAQPSTKCRCGRPCRTGRGTVGLDPAWHCDTARVEGLEPCPHLSVWLTDLADRLGTHQGSSTSSPCTDEAGALRSEPGCVVPAVVTTTTPSDFLSAGCHFPGSPVIDSTASRRPQTRGRGGSLQFPGQPSDHSTPLTPGGFLDTRSRTHDAVHGLRPLRTGSAPPCPPSGGRH